MRPVLLMSMLLLAALVPAQQQAVDWKVRCETKVGEIKGVIEILNPVVAFLTDAFKQHKFTETTTEEWADALAQFTLATKAHDKAQEWMQAGQFDKRTFLKLEEAWQYYVKTGVAGLRAKGMVENELGITP